MGTEFEQRLAETLADFQRALDEGLAAGMHELARRLAKDPDYERPTEPKVIEVNVRREQIANGAGSLYRGPFVAAGERAAVDTRRGDRGARITLEPATEYTAMLRFAVVYV